MARLLEVEVHAKGADKLTPITLTLNSMDQVRICPFSKHYMKETDVSTDRTPSDNSFKHLGLGLLLALLPAREAHSSRPLPNLLPRRAYARTVDCIQEADHIGNFSKTIDASKPAFKPRKVKKTIESGYRDRAAERRVGEGNDFAQVCTFSCSA